MVSSKSKGVIYHATCRYLVRHWLKKKVTSGFGHGKTSIYNVWKNCSEHMKEHETSVISNQQAQKSDGTVNWTKN